MKGVVIPTSQFVTNPDLVSSRSFTLLLDAPRRRVDRRHAERQARRRPRLGACDAAGHRPLDLHRDDREGLADLAFVVTVENSGDFQEVNVPVTLTIDARRHADQEARRRSPSILPAQRQTRHVHRASTSRRRRSATPATVKVEVGPVAGEIITSNNSATYTVFFTLRS